MLELYDPAGKSILRPVVTELTSLYPEHFCYWGYLIVLRLRNRVLTFILFRSELETVRACHDIAEVDICLFGYFGGRSY